MLDSDSDKLYGWKNGTKEIKQTVKNNILYHVGATFKVLGKKCFAINKIEDKECLYKITNSV